MYKHSNINPNYIPTGNVFEQPHCKYLATSTDTVSQLRIVRERKRQCCVLLDCIAEIQIHTSCVCIFGTINSILCLKVSLYGQVVYTIHQIRAK